MDPRGHLMATHQVESGDAISVDRPEDSPELTFLKDGASIRLPHWIARVPKSGLRGTAPARSPRTHVSSPGLAAAPSHKTSS